MLEDFSLRPKNNSAADVRKYFWFKLKISLLTGFTNESEIRFFSEWKVNANEMFKIGYITNLAVKQLCSNFFTAKINLNKRCL